MTPQVEFIMEDFDGEYGDRRQEIIFIGTALSEKDIIEALDTCLLTDSEMEDYKQRAMREDAEAAREELLERDVLSI